MSFVALEALFSTWAASRQDIRLAIVVGSRARGDWSNDAWGDLDTVIWTTTPDAYATPACLDALGQVWAACWQPIRPGVGEWLAVLSGGLDFDMAVVPAQNPLTPTQVLAADMGSVFARGVRVLLDRDGVWSRLPACCVESRPLPDAAAFDQALHRFWRYAGRAGKKLGRGELWVATQIINSLLQEQVLALAEWHTLAANPVADVWYDGHFLERWADSRVVEALSDALAPYDAAGAWLALEQVCGLFDWLSAETAGRLGYPTPAALTVTMMEYLRRLEAGETPG